MDYEKLLEEQEQRYKKTIDYQQEQIDDLYQQNQKILEQNKDYQNQLKEMIDKYQSLQKDNMKLQDQIIQYQDYQSNNHVGSMKQLLQQHVLSEASNLSYQIAQSESINQINSQISVKNNQQTLIGFNNTQQNIIKTENSLIQIKVQHKKDIGIIASLYQIKLLIERNVQKNQSIFFNKIYFEFKIHRMIQKEFLEQKVKFNNFILQKDQESLVLKKELKHKNMILEELEKYADQVYEINQRNKKN